MFKIGPPKTSTQWHEYYDLRWKTLRRPWNQPRGSERDDLEATADHVAARDRDGRLLGVGRLHLNDATEAQIRYMAVAEEARGQSVGRAIVEELERLARGHGVARIVLNARDPVAGFYERLGYSELGPGPTMFDEVKHVRMEKQLNR